MTGWIAGVVVAALGGTATAQSSWSLEPAGFGMDATKIPVGDNGPKTDHTKSPSVAYKPTGTVKSPTALLVFFAGVPGAPDQDSAFMKEAAARGYYTIGLDYINDAAAGDLCSCHEGCIDALGAQLVDGTPSGFFDKFFVANTPTANAQAYNSIDNRFGYFTQKLKKLDPTGPWDKFCKTWDTADSTRCTVPDWSKIAVAGHSNGGYVATWIAKNKGAPKALLLSAPTPRFNMLTEPNHPTQGQDTADYNSNPLYTKSVKCTAADKGDSLYTTAFPKAVIRAFISFEDLRYKGGPNFEKLKAHDIPGNLNDIGLKEHRVHACTVKHPTLDPTWQWITSMDTWDKNEEHSGSSNHNSTANNNIGATWCNNYGVTPWDFRTLVWDWMLDN